MAGPFVLDSSALAKLFLNEPETPAFKAWIHDRLQSQDPLVSPSLLAYELGQIARQVRAAPEPARAVRAALSMVGLVSHESVVGGALEARLAKSLYDGCFLFLARSIGATIVTYDQRMRREAAAVQIPTLSP